MTIYERMGLHIANRRLVMGLTELELAGRAKIHRNTVYRIESGRGMNIDSIVKICQVLNLTLDSLMEEIKPSNDIQLELWNIRRKDAGPSMHSDSKRRSDVLRHLQPGMGYIGPGASGMRKSIKVETRVNPGTTGGRHSIQSMLELQERLARLRNSVLSRES